jgi:hypothetical protein
MAEETVIELRYQLCLLDIPIEGPTNMYGDNMAVILNTRVPSSQLKKKHIEVAYNRVQEAIAAGIVTFRHISTKVSLADCLTKLLPTEQFQRAVEPMLFRHLQSMYPAKKGAPQDTTIDKSHEMDEALGQPPDLY